MATYPRHTITLPPELSERLRARCGGETRQFSAEVQHLITHHLAAVALGRRRLAAQLSRPEIMAVLDVMNGTYWDASTLPMMLAGGVAATVADGCALDDLHIKWVIDRDHLVHTVRDLDDLEALALLDLVHELWQRTDDNWRELLADFRPTAAGEGASASA